jgi:hypothetical protein
VQKNWAAAALVVAFTTTATAQVAILQIRIVEGEGGVHTAGAHLSKPLTIEVTDETGRPVAAAAVSFHLPEDGPGGTFATGLRTQVEATDDRGRAVLHSLVLNRLSGRFQIRVFASKEQARAGIVSFQYIAGSGAVEVAASTQSPAIRPSRGHGKWLAITLAVAGGAAAALVTMHSHGSSTSSTSSGASVSVGSPSLTLGRP